MNQDNDSISFDDEPISIEGNDDPIVIKHAPEPISIAPVEEEPLTIAEGGSGRSISHTRGGTTLGAKGHKFSRPMQQSGKGATRCRIFRSKISVPAVESLEEHINEWLDSDDIDVKDVGHMIGTMHGKSDEDNIIITVWY
ncbi:MAG: hypothetical protein HN350_09335 [Phycisphaerales bacterium]|jgi:hypothetical protein|nr:hypothetical protein [Phycisphaerales bacterium]